MHELSTNGRIASVFSLSLSLMRSASSARPLNVPLTLRSASFGRLGNGDGDGGDRHLPKKPSEPYKFKWRYLLFLPFILLLGLAGASFNKILNKTNTKALKTEERVVERRSEQENREN